MLKLLLPSDGSDHAEAALRHVILLHRAGVVAGVRLLNVQVPLPGDVSAFVAADVIADHHREQSDQALAGAVEALGEAGVPFQTEHAVGPVAATIARVAAERGVDQIVMGCHGYGALGGLVMGSVASRVVHLAEVPVTLVK